MNAREKADELIRSVGDAIGIPELALDAEGYSCLSFDDKIVLNIQFNPNNNHLMLFTDLGDVPAERRADVYAQMLKGNRFWLSTGGATLSLDDEDIVMLASQEPCENLTPVQLQEIIERFIDSAEEWAEFIQGKPTAEDMAVPPDSGPADGVPPFGIRA